MKSTKTKKNTKKQVMRAVSIVSIACLTACSSSSDTSEMEIVVDNENSAEIIDPRSILSSLEFESAESQASYQCLLSAANGTATAEGMQAIPAWWRDDPTVGRGSFQTWCKTSGEGALVEGDLDRCTQDAVNAMQAPGTTALSVVTVHLSANGPVSTIGHTSKHIPESGTAGWAVSFAKTFAGSTANQDALAINFERFDGNELIEESGNLQHPYFYRDSDIGLTEFVRTDRTVNAYLTDYTGSAAQFKSTTNEYLSAVMVQIEEAIRGKDGLTEEAVSSALQRANAEIDQSKAFFDLNGDDLHQVLLTRETYLDCE